MRSINFLHFMLPFNIFHFHAHKSASMLDLLQLALLLRFNIVHPHLHLMLRFNISHLHLHTCKPTLDYVLSFFNASTCGYASTLCPFHEINEINRNEKERVERTG